MNAVDPDHDAWLVDLDGTLYRPGPLKLMMAVELALLGAPAIGAIRKFRAEHERLRAERVACESPFELQLERAARAAGIETQRMRTLVEEWMVRRPARRLARVRRHELFDEVERFRAAGGRTAIVSDYPARAKLAGLGATALFEVVVANGEPGGPTELKPSPVGYLAAASRLGVAPARCLVIGDRDDADGEAARRAGMAFRLCK